MPDSERSNWEIRTSQDVAEALDWLRRRCKGNALVLVAIGPNSVAFAKDVKLSPRDATELVRAQLGTLHAGFERCVAEKVTRAASRRRDVE